MKIWEQVHRYRFGGAVSQLSLFLQTPSCQFTQKPPSIQLFSALILLSTALVMRFCFKKLYQAHRSRHYSTPRADQGLDVWNKVHLKEAVWSYPAELPIILSHKELYIFPAYSTLRRVWRNPSQRASTPALSPPNSRDFLETAASACLLKDFSNFPRNGNPSSIFPFCQTRRSRNNDIATPAKSKSMDRNIICR